MAVEASKCPPTGRLDVGSTVFMMCDMQERFRPAIAHFTEIVEVARRLVVAGKLFKVPLLITEQYPKGLGKTVAELSAEITDGYGTCVEKTRFSMVLPEFESQLANAKSIVLFGVEAHVCVQQTTLDLLARHKQVHVVSDATSSRSQQDRKMAFERLRSSGAFITTAESVIFELLGDKEHEHFKAVQAIIKTIAPDSGL